MGDGEATQTAAGGEPVTRPWLTEPASPSHAPFHVTGVKISQQTRTGCGVDVTGRITTNGSAGTLSYQWLFQPDRLPPQPLSQSAVAGQQAVYVTVAVEGQGHGSVSQTVTLQVLGPDKGAASTAVVVRC